jgi:sodium-dependent dicarboxylate transporter 2/3/5
MRPLVGSTHPLLLIVLVCTLMTFLTEITSNTALTSLMLPVLMAASTAAGLDPRLLLLPATLSTSCAFMLPMGTPPNAIVFSSGCIPMSRMASVGFAINWLGVVLISALMWLWAKPLLGIDVTVAPSWLR